MNIAIGRDDVLAEVERVHARRFDDEVVVLDLNGGDYFTLNATGARIWEGLVSGRTPAQVGQDLAIEFDVEYEQAVSDCVSLAVDLVARGLMRRSLP